MNPDLAQARRYLAALDSAPDARFGFRTCPDKGADIRLAVKCCGTLDQGVRQSSDPAKDGRKCNPAGLLKYMQTLGAGAFVMPNETDGKGQLKANVTRVHAVYVDADTAEQVARLRAFIAVTGLEPTVLVASGGIHDGVEKLQANWRVEGCPVAEFTRTQLTLVSRIGTDPAVQDAGRVMRLPGFLHMKKEPRMSCIVSLSPDAIYEFSSFLARVRAQPQIVDPWVRGKGSGHGRGGTRHRGTATQPDAGSPAARLRVLLDRHGGLITPSIHALLREAKAPIEGAGGNRHSTLLAVAARCVQIGWPDADIRQLVLPVAIGSWDVDPRELSDRLDQVLAWVRRQEAAALPATPTSARAAHLAAAFGSGRGIAR